MRDFDRRVADDLVVRPASPEDAGAIAEIRVRGWQTAYRGQLDDGLLDGMSPEQDERRWLAHLSSPPEGFRAFVARRQGETVGFVACGPSRDPDDGEGVGEVYAIYARSDSYGSGVGRALLGRAMDALRVDGYGEAILWVLETNSRAHRFYEAAGWHADGRIRDDVLDRFHVREIRYRHAFGRQ